MNISIKTAGGALECRSPYNAIFVERARNLGGKFRGGAWYFDARDESRVREVCREVYGSDGLTSDTITLRIEWTESRAETCGPLTVSGRTIATAFGRDSGAKLGDGVVVLAGGFDSGGSVKNWQTKVSAGTIALVRDFPRSLADKLSSNKYQSRIYSIEPESPPVDRAALESERARLLARIAEIDALNEVKDYD